MNVGFCRRASLVEALFGIESIELEVLETLR